METSRGHSPPEPTFRRGAFQRRLALVFALQLAGVVIAVLLGVFDVAPLAAVLALIGVISVLAWLAARREWAPVSALARVIDGWNEQQPDPQLFSLARLSPRTDADLARLARGLYGFAERIAGYNERERNFTRDASHELRSPLTVIKMSADMLGDEAGLSEFGDRSVQRIKRAAREMEALVESLLVLARGGDQGTGDEEFVVNEVLRRELGELRQVLEGQTVEFALEEPARFALHGSSRVFAVLCWQLIRNACQHLDQGRVVLTVLPGAVTVACLAQAGRLRAEGQAFELTIAQRISERFAWTLELETREGNERVASIRFPHPLPA
ncbi:sensor histidine kinase [Fulvimonas soli]|jgi:signal transduction histidine kinase|uniref:histidine kinase n=1 Tax=Fulvimonas soli TaxID=155197 RepID=A0A316HVV1_9GAMM|nr:HAMP domain-containing sensor histidine kinase [Fulvimonas soli]PWK84760.1 signal transduction histidine kinase [Fulvimonas soli]TNY27343.1 histidine kinase [Fulvimonas soli]